MLLLRIGIDIDSKMMAFIGLGQKRTTEIDLVKPLGQQLTTYYGSNTNYDNDLENLNKLRKAATFKDIDGKESSTLTALQKYYDQIKNFSEKCPIGDVPINFKWKDSFEKASYSFIPSGSTSQIIQSIAYEKVCVLYNLGACYSEIAANMVNQDVHNEYALQLAAKYFQIAAGIFLSLKTDVPAALGTRCTHVDMNPTILNIFHLLMLAQAQEAFCIKASGMSDKSIAKIAAQCSVYYNECHKLIQVVKNIWPSKEWTNHIVAKQLVYNAISDYHQSVVAKELKKYGEEISWLKHANEMFESAEAKVDQPDHIKQYHKRSVRRFEDAVKENDFIYHARVPEYRLLDVLERVSLVNPAEVPDQFSNESTELFKDLMPLRFQQAWQRFEARKQEVVSRELAGLQEATANLNAILASLNLPASLEDASVVDLPQSLKDKSKYVRQRGGIQHVTKLINQLPELLKRNKDILSAIAESLRQEEEQDTMQRNRYGPEKWSRKPSSFLNKAWLEEIQKYESIIKNAVEADEKVKAKFLHHERQIALLSSDSISAIQNAIPTGYNHPNAPCVKKLRELMSDIEALKKNRLSLEEQLKNLDVSSIKKQFEVASKSSDSFDDSAMIGETIGQLLGPLEKKARESKDQQDVLLKEIQCSNDDFVEARGGMSSAAMERDTFFSSLSITYDAFNDLLHHLEEGTKFYDDLTRILVDVQTKVDDFCYSRKIEQDYR